MLGFMKRENSKIEGLTGKEYNLMNPFDPNSPRVYVSDNAPDVSPDPHHDIPDTIVQQFGGLNMTHLDATLMNGFVANGETHMKGLGVNVMKCHTPKTVPVISSLAREFGLFNYWFSAAPASTEPNRMYLHSATSYGAGLEPGYAQMYSGYPQKTIFESLEDAGKSWKVYYAQTSTILWFQEMRKSRYWNNFWAYSRFFDDVKSGNLPTYSFIEPRYFSIPFYPAEDQHPDHPVSAGEYVLKEIYEVLRNSDLWNRTALLITYDEHGGFYDHVQSPIKGVPAPDDQLSHDFDDVIGKPFNFTRLGVRVPTIIVSPWVPKGTIINRPQGPTATSQYDHSSLCATLKTMYNLEGYLTKRDEWAGNFEFVFNLLDKPRTDCPTKLPDPVVGSKMEIEMWTKSGQNKVSGLQKSLIRTLARMNGDTWDEKTNPIENEHHGAQVLEHHMKKFHRVHRWT